MVANVTLNTTIEELASTMSTTTETEAAATSLFSSTASDAANVDTVTISSTSAASSDTEVERLTKELNAKKGQKAANEQRIANLQQEVETLQEKIQTEINEAIKKAEGLADDQKKQMESKSSDILNAYTKREISYDEMQSQMKEGFQSISSGYGSQIAEAVSTATAASSEMEILKGNIDEMISLTETNRLLDNEIAQGEISLQAAIDRAAQQKSDPIGFMKGGTRYDFYIDKDDNGKLSNANEFLGASNQWAEMTALDADGSGIVDTAELEKAGVKVAVTQNGVTYAKSASELGIDNIDLSSYKKDGSTDKNGNTLLGTFGLTMGGSKIDNAYNSLDTLEWLNKTYDFSDNKNSAGRFGSATGISENPIEKSLTIHNTLKGNLAQAFAEMNMTENLLKIGKTEQDMKASDDMKAAEEEVKKEDKEQEEALEEQQQEELKKEMEKKLKA